MFIFNHATLYLILTFFYIIPALAIAISFKRFTFLERFLLGLPTTFILFGTLLSIIGFLLGQVNYISIGLSYLLMLGIIYWWGKNNFEIPDFKKIISSLQDYKNNMELWAVLGVLLIASLAFLIRMSSFSPIYIEFDPYFYLEGAKMLLKYGVIPLSDDSAWYPYNKSTHRSPPIVHYTIGYWDFLYSSLNNVNMLDRYILSAVANYYPPLMAMGIAIMFYFIGYSLTGNRWIGLGMSIFAAYVPIFIFKFMSGVFEMQPFNFFIFSYLSGMLALYVKYKEEIFKHWLGLGTLAALIGAVASPAIAIYLTLALLIYAWKNNDDMPLYVFLGSLIGGLWLFVYTGSLAKLKYSLLLLVPVILPRIKSYYETLVKKHGSNVVIASFILLIIGAWVLHNFFGSIIYSALVAAQYNTPLERTIQEQALAGPSLSMVGTMGTPASVFLQSQNPLLNLFGYLYVILTIPGEILNLLISLIISILQSFGLNTTWYPKEPSLAYGITAVAILWMFWELYKVFIKNQDPSPELIVAIGAVPLLIGLIKAKFQIYFIYGFLLFLSYILVKLGKYVKHRDAPLGIALLLIIFAGYGFLTNISLTMASFVPTYGNNPSQMGDLFQLLCASGQSQFCNVSLEDLPITLQYNAQLCQYDLFQKYGQNLDTGKQIRIQIACNYMPPEWLNPMEWIYKFTEPDSRIISWWDYGHWINYWGERKAVIRNEHSVLKMILDTAYAFVMGNETTLRNTMNKYGSNYAMIDREIVMGSSELFGGKFFALNYLACADANQTSVEHEPMTSVCEWKNLWEVIRMDPTQTCTINGVRQGYVGYVRDIKGTTGNVQPIWVKKYCITPNDGSLNISRLKTPLAKALLVQANPQVIYIAYKLNETDPAKKLQKALLVPIADNAFVSLYLKDKMWYVNGQWVDGYNDRTTRFYDSVLYKAYVMDHMDGFKQVYNNGYVKIYK